MNTDNNNVVIVDVDLEDLIPGFLENRKNDVSKLSAALSSNDFDTLKSMGHSLKGVGGGYGFHEISRLGAEIEQAAKQQSAENISQLISDFDLHLNTLEVKFQ